HSQAATAAMLRNRQSHQIRTSILDSSPHHPSTAAFDMDKREGRIRISSSYRNLHSVCLLSQVPNGHRLRTFSFKTARHRTQKPTVESYLNRSVSLNRTFATIALNSSAGFIL